MAHIEEGQMKTPDSTLGGGLKIHNCDCARRCLKWRDTGAEQAENCDRQCNMTTGLVAERKEVR
jgi:hypothetical protein